MIEDAEEVTRRDEQEIPAEIVPALVAAAAVFLGARFSICSLELIPPRHESANRWMRQGRTFVQASHNLRTKR